LEVIAALALLAMAIVLVAQLAIWSLTERGRSRDVQIATELAVNVLEEARAASWNDLTPAWAAARRLPPDLTERDWQLSVAVSPESEEPLLKRVTVQVQPRLDSGRSLQPIEMVAVLSARSTLAKEDQP
jgi:hypothetical protein